MNTSIATNIVPLPLPQVTMLKKFHPPTLAEVLEACEKTGLPQREGEKFMAYFESVGWVVGKSKKPMVSWRGALATWKMNWQDRQQDFSKPSPSVEAIKNQTALTRCEERIKYLRGQFPLTDAKLKNEWNTLKEERLRLLGILGFKA